MRNACTQILVGVVIHVVKWVGATSLPVYTQNATQLRNTDTESQSLPQPIASVTQHASMCTKA